MKRILLQVASPEKAGAYKERPSKDTQFKKFYERGDFPIALENDKKGNKIAWKVDGWMFNFVTLNGGCSIRWN